MRRIFPLIIMLALALSACDDDTADIGAPCDHDGHCQSGRCHTDGNTGYCTAVCDTQGSMSECPEGTICSRIEDNQRRCLLLCEQNADCPTNSDCEDVRDTNFRACEPDD